MDGIGIIVFAAFVLIAIIIVVKKSVRIVQQGTFMIVERVGKCQVSFTFFYETNILEDSKTRYSLHYSYY